MFRFNLSLYDSKYTVNDLIDLFNLSNCEKTRISKLSRGEQKRFTIAQGILNEAEILVIDEPISELDEMSSIIILQILKNLS